MTWADYLILIVILVSAVIGLWRGLLREVVSLVTWVVGFWVALRFARPVGDVFQVVHNPSVRFLIGFILIYVLILILGAVVNFVVHKLVAKTGSSGTDRLLGGVFGLARGVVVVAALVLIGSFTLLPRHDGWRESRLIPYARPLAGWIRGAMPPEMTADVRRQAGRMQDSVHKLKR